MAVDSIAPPKASWADEIEEEEDAFQPMAFTDENGIKTVIEYRENEDGRKVKVTRKIRSKLVTEHVNKTVAQRKKWAKFGEEEGNKPGPDVATTTIGESIPLKLGSSHGKAGITTILNSRTSVLAAANPVFGRYDDMKSPGENIDFQTTILSRFDMIFIVKDEHNEARDMSIARHVLNVHMNRRTQGVVAGEFDLEKMKAYINYCRAKCAPRLTAEAAEKLSSHFVSIRKEVKETERETQVRSSIPITIRQLEAIIRISESLAKMTLSPVASEKHVEEAIRLFKYSTMDAVQSGGADGMSRNEIMVEVQTIEAEIQRRLPIGSQVPVTKIKSDFLQQGYSEAAILRALTILGRREILLFRNQGKTVLRQAV